MNTQQNNRHEFWAPPELVTEFDKVIMGKFSSRSEALRHLMRQYCEAMKRDNGDNSKQEPKKA